jgi:hypothetical protein
MAVAAKDTVTVRVREERALTLADGNGSMLYVADDELELPDDEAKQLEQQGFVEPT